LDAAEYSKGGEVFVLKMPILKITDLAHSLISSYQSVTGNSKDIAVVETGIRPGEKLYEELMTLEESERAYENDKMYIIPSFFNPKEQEYPEFKTAKRQEYSSFTAPRLDAKEISELIEKYNLGFTRRSL